MKSNQKVVIRENADQSTAFILEVENKYLPAIQNLSNHLKSIGLTPSKELISSALAGDFEAIEMVYRPIIEADKAKFSSPAMREQIDIMFLDNMNNLRDLVNELFSGSIGNQYAGGLNCNSFESLTKNNDRWGYIPMNSLSLAPFLELDENGDPVLNEEAKQSITDAFREYATTSEAKVYEAQKEAAKALNSLAAVLFDAGIRIDLDFLPHVFFRRFFKVQQSDEGKFTVTEQIEGIR